MRSGVQQKNQMFFHTQEHNIQQAERDAAGDAERVHGLDDHISASLGNLIVTNDSLSSPTAVTVQFSVVLNTWAEMNVRLPLRASSLIWS